MKTIPLSVLMLAFLMFASCKKTVDDPELLATYNLTDLEKSFYPYSGNYNPKYITDSVEIYFDTQRNNSFMINTPVNSFGDYYQHEVGLSALINENYVLEYFSTPEVFELGIHSQISGLWSTNNSPDPPNYFQFNFRIPLDSNQVDTSQFMIDSLLVKEKWYKEILSGPVIYSVPPPIVDSIYPVRYYYTGNDGVVKFDMSDGSVWELIEN